MAGESSEGWLPGLFLLKNQGDFLLESLSSEIGGGGYVPEEKSSRSELFWEIGDGVGVLIAPEFLVEVESYQLMLMSLSGRVARLRGWCGRFACD